MAEACAGFLGAAGAIRHPSPNFAARRGGCAPELVVIHYTAMRDADATLERLCDPEVEVSAHYLIGACGTLWQLVDERSRAWHAGAGSWRGCGDVNSRSIGIELDNDGAIPFAEEQLRVLETVLAGVMTRHGIAPAGVIAHSDCAPGRKTDPGALFDWDRLVRAGLAAPMPRVGGAGGSPHDPGVFARSMAAAGYTGSRDPAALLGALRLRHRPGATGPLDARDMALARALADGGAGRAVDAAARGA